MKTIIQTTKLIINNTLANFTLAKFGAALFTITMVSLIKFSISGNLHISYCEFWNNVGIGLLGWTINTSTLGWLSEYLGIKGINFNLNQFLYGFHTIGPSDGPSSENIKAKLYNAMESDDGSDPGKRLDKGKGIDRGYYQDGSGSDINPLDKVESETKPLDKGKGIDRRVHPLYTGTSVGQVTEPPFAVWSRVFPGVDPTSVFFPKKINPGPGFNVPGGEVPLQDEICKHLDYNSHILSQFKKMDLQTAIEQRDNYMKYIQVMNQKTAYAQDALSKVPTIPTTEYEFKLRNQILRDLDALSIGRVRAEAKATLLNSRIEFIQINRKPGE
jgi:hypothetical protein